MPVTIQEIPLAESQRILSFQVAAAAALGKARSVYPNVRSDIVLFQGGCMLNDGTNNCTRACLNASLAIRSISSIQNCMVYPVISRLIASSNLSASAADLADHYGIVATANTTAINQILTACFNEACNHCNSSYYTCPRFGTPQSNWASTLQVELNRLGCFPDICASVDASVHPDIGGIGSVISYFMQIAIILAAWTTLRFFNTWTRNLIFCLTCPLGFSRARQIAARCQEKLKGSSQHAALKTALVEFHKAQCYFMLAFQIAALVALRAGSQILESKSYEQMYRNIFLLSNISTCGFLPVAFVLFCLHSEGMKSWYAYILSTSTVAASMVTFFTASNFSASPAYMRNASRNLNNCGGNPNPVNYCLNPFLPANRPLHMLSSMTNPFSGGSTLAFSLIVMALLFVDQCEPFRRRDDDGKERRVNGYMCLKMWIKDWPIWRRTGSLTFLKWMWLDTAERAIRSGTAIALLTIEVYYLLSITNFITGLSVVTYNNLIIPEHSWSFGQIIAVMIWVPSVVEYIYLTLRGMRAGSQYRIPKPYHVVKDIGG